MLGIALANGVPRTLSQAGLATSKSMKRELPEVNRATSTLAEWQEIKELSASP